MNNFTNEEIKEAMEKNENMQTPRFKVFQFCSKNIEEVVQSIIKLWKTMRKKIS